MNNYWKEREAEKIKLEDIYLEEQIKKMSSLLNKVISDIDTEIAKLYLKYSKDNGISYQDALIYLKDDERKEFQKDLKYYIDTCRNEEKLDKYRQELQALSTRARVKRLEVLKAKIRMGATDIEGFLKNDNVNVLKDIYSESYLHSMFSMECAKGIEVKFNEPNLNNVKKLLEHPWSGKNYSSKIWDTTGNFVNKMDSIVTTGLIQGKSYNVIARELEKAKVGKNGNGGLRYQCERLIRTEAAFITEQATKDSYEKYGVEEYEYSATLDLRTSEICSELDNKVFKVSEAITGVNYPPMHVNCRSTTVPVVRWEGEETEDDVRIYRDPITGKNNYAKVKDYAEWKDMQYEKYGESKITAEQKKIRNKASDKIQFEKYRRELGSLVPSRFDEFQEIKYNDNETWERLSYNYKLETIYNLDKLKHTENFASIKAIKHILEGEINRRGKAVGFHMENMPTRKGNIIENTRSAVDENGIYKAKVVINGIRKQAQSSFFPTKMIPQQIIDAINEAYNRKNKISENKYSGKTSYGFEIIMYLDSNDKIITAYPIKL